MVEPRRSKPVLSRSNRSVVIVDVGCGLLDHIHQVRWDLLHRGRALRQLFLSFD